MEEHEEHHDNDYLENDIGKRFLKHLHELGYEAEIIKDSEIDLSNLNRLTECVSSIKIKGMEFDLIQILTRG